MEGVNKTLYIPLYGKAMVSKKGIILHDALAESIWQRAGVELSGKSKNKHLAYFMAMRSAVFDAWLRSRLEANPHAVVLHLGCGLDARIHRVQKPKETAWYDVDFPSVIEERRKHFCEGNGYTMVSADVTAEDWLSAIPGEEAIVVMEGISMYLAPEALSALFCRLGAHFKSIRLLMDCYSTFAAKAGKHKNPIHKEGVKISEVYGLDDPALPAAGTGIAYVKEHVMTPAAMIDELSGMEKTVFKNLYAGKMAKKLYRMYEYAKG